MDAAAAHPTLHTAALNTTHLGLVRIFQLKTESYNVESFYWFEHLDSQCAGLVPVTNGPHANSVRAIAPEDSYFCVRSRLGAIEPSDFDFSR